MVLLQPLVLKNISLLIFEDLLFRNNFNSIAIIESRAPKLVPYRLGLFMVLLQSLCWGEGREWKDALVRGTDLFDCCSIWVMGF